jgi:membrane protease YdiL (CAAX protease family)
VSALVFAAIHVTPGGYRVPFALALGLALGALRLRTGSVLPGIAAHAVLNSITLAIAPFLDTSALEPAPVDIRSALGLLALGGAAALVLTRAMAPLTPGTTRT